MSRTYQGLLRKGCSSRSICYLGSRFLLVDRVWHLQCTCSCGSKVGRRNSDEFKVEQSVAEQDQRIDAEHNSLHDQPRAVDSRDLVSIEPVYALHVPPPLLDPSLSDVLEYTQDADHVDDGSARSIYRVREDARVVDGELSIAYEHYDLFYWRQA